MGMDNTSLVCPLRRRGIPPPLVVSRQGPSAFTRNSADVPRNRVRLCGVELSTGAAGALGRRHAQLVKLHHHQSSPQSEDGNSVEHFHQNGRRLREALKSVDPGQRHPPTGWR